MKRFCLFILILMTMMTGLMAQDLQSDTPADKKNKKQTEKRIDKRAPDPKAATWWALLPGAGQAYNRKYWKMPIVYAGFGVTGYFGVRNGNDYRLYRDAYDFKSGTNTDVSDKAKEEAAKYSSENLVTLRDYYRRNMELSWIIMAVWYAVQIIDANVDAHFYYYEVNDDLSIQVDPKWDPAFTDYSYGYGKGFGTAGISLKLNF